MALNIINFTDMIRREKDEISWDVRITMKLICHSYLVPSLGNRVMKLCIETGLTLLRLNYLVYGLGNRVNDTPTAN